MLAVSGRLLPRDYTLALLLAEHRVVTTPQITAVLFGSPYSCRKRLHLLRLLRVLRLLRLLDRFSPHRARSPGSDPLDYRAAGRPIRRAAP